MPALITGWEVMGRALDAQPQLLAKHSAKEFVQLLMPCFRLRHQHVVDLMASVVEKLFKLQPWQEHNPRTARAAGAGAAGSQSGTAAPGQPAAAEPTAAAAAIGPDQGLPGGVVVKQEPGLAAAAPDMAGAPQQQQQAAAGNAGLPPLPVPRPHAVLDAAAAGVAHTDERQRATTAVSGAAGQGPAQAGQSSTQLAVPGTGASANPASPTAAALAAVAPAAPAMLTPAVAPATATTPGAAVAGGPNAGAPGAAVPGAAVPAGAQAAAAAPGAPQSAERLDAAAALPAQQQQPASAAALAAGGSVAATPQPAAPGAATQPAEAAAEVDPDIWDLQNAVLQVVRQCLAKGTDPQQNLLVSVAAQGRARGALRCNVCGCPAVFSNAWLLVTRLSQLLTVFCCVFPCCCHWLCMCCLCPSAAGCT